MAIKDLSLKQVADKREVENEARRRPVRFPATVFHNSSCSRGFLLPRQCPGLFGCKPAAVWLSDVPPDWHTDTGSCGHLNSHKKGDRRQPRTRQTFSFLPNGDADARRRPQRVNSQPKWLNGTAFLHQSHSVPSILPGCAINKGGGFYIKSSLVTCRGSAATQTLTVPNNDRIPKMTRHILVCAHLKTQIWCLRHGRHLWKHRSQELLQDGRRTSTHVVLEGCPIPHYLTTGLFPACRFNRDSKVWACWGSPIIGVEKLTRIMWHHSCFAPDIWLLGPVSIDGNLLEPISEIRLE